MDRQSRETPMDFSYDNGTGPVDTNSPFMTFANRHSLQNGKRPYSVFSSSPSKSQSNTFPSLRPAAGQRTLFSDIPVGPARVSPEKPLPNLPSFDHARLFNTPRKLDFDFSSGGETPDTPGGNNADSEATPDENVSKANMRRVFVANESERPDKSPSRKKRQSIFSELWHRKPPKAGKGEIVTTSYSHKAADRVAKRRQQKSRNKELMKYYDDAEFEGDGAGRRKHSEDSAASSSSSSHRTTTWAALASFFSYVESHPYLPHVLSYYAQLLLNVFLALSTCWILWSFWSAIQSDVDKASAEAVASLLTEISACAAQFRDNDCPAPAAALRKPIAPALQALCDEWSACMSRDPKQLVGRARVSAHTFAKICNAFVEEISYKAMFFAVFFVAALFLAVNATFGFYRRQHTADPFMVANVGAAYGMPPSTPHRQPSAGQLHFGAGTPWAKGQDFTGQQRALEPQPSHEAGSPRKQIEYR